jgi:hypothetical protein
VLAPAAALSGLVVEEAPPISPRAINTPTSDETMPRALREAWYVPFIEAAARFFLAANVVLTIAVPAFLLLGGLVSLVKAGDPRALLAFHLGPIPLAYSLLGLFLGVAAIALFWAAPMLVVLDLSRRLRVLSKRVEGMAKSIEKP